MMTKQQQTDRFIEGCFNRVNLKYIERGYTLYEDIFPVGEDCEGYPMWGFLWESDSYIVDEFIKSNIEKINEVGFLIYETEEGDLLIGIDGAGYDFYEQHWIPLFDLYLQDRPTE